jgi:hypothetical protein
VYSPAASLDFFGPAREAVLQGELTTRRSAEGSSISEAAPFKTVKVFEPVAEA